MARLLPVAICLRNRLLRDGIALILKNAGYRIQISVSNPNEFKAAKIKADGRHLVLVGGHPGTTFNPDWISDIKDVCPQSTIVVIVDACSEDMRAQYEKLGASGVLLKSISSEILIASLHLVTLGEHVFSAPALDHSEPEVERVELPERASDQLILLSDYHREKPALKSVALPGSVSCDRSKLVKRGELSERELEILSCLVAGHSNKMIARICNISESTVKVHLKTILRKTEVANRTQAAIWALNNDPFSSTEPAPNGLSA